MIKAQYSEYYNWPCYSYLYQHPIPVEHWPPDSYRDPSLNPPQFCEFCSAKLISARLSAVDTNLAVTVGDPVDLALEWAQTLGGADHRIPFIAAANDKR